MAWDHSFRQTRPRAFDGNARKRAHPDLNQGPADLQSAALTTELCTHILALDARACKHNTLHRFTREGIGSHSKMGTLIICSLHYRCAPRRFHDSVASTPRTHRNSALKIDKQGGANLAAPATSKTKIWKRVWCRCLRLYIRLGHDRNSFRAQI